MHYSNILAAAIVSIASLTAALPAGMESSVLEARAAPLCSGASTTPLCCATDVLGVADLDCAPPPQTPTNGQDFTKICASIGQRARCCLLPILEQGLVCSAPVGTG